MSVIGVALVEGEVLHHLDNFGLYGSTGFLAAIDGGADYDTALRFASCCGSATAASKDLAKRSAVDKLLVQLNARMEKWEADKAEEAEKAAKKAEREAEKAAKKAEREAEKAAKKAEREAEKAAKKASDSE